MGTTCTDTGCFAGRPCHPVVAAGSLVSSLPELVQKWLTEVCCACCAVLCCAAGSHCQQELLCSWRCRGGVGMRLAQRQQFSLARTKEGQQLAASRAVSGACGTAGAACLLWRCRPEKQDRLNFFLLPRPHGRPVCRLGLAARVRGQSTSNPLGNGTNEHQFDFFFPLRATQASYTQTPLVHCGAMSSPPPLSLAPALLQRNTTRP